MSPIQLLVLLLALSGLSQFIGQRRSMSLAAPLGGPRYLASLPVYYGGWMSLSVLLPGAVLLGGWLLAEDSIILDGLVSQLPASVVDGGDAMIELTLNSIVTAAAGANSTLSDPALLPLVDTLSQAQADSHSLLAKILIALCLLMMAIGYRRISVDFVARASVERIFLTLLFLCAGVAVVTTIGILLSVLFEAIRFFNMVPVTEFLFGTEWSPQIALRADQQGSSGRFGVLPLMTGTLLVSVIALAVAVPVGLMSAIYLSEYAESKWRDRLKPALEILAGIPTVVYGVFAALTVAPLVRELGTAIGLSVSSESALAAGLVMGIMIIPFVSSLSDDIIHAVPQSMRDGSLALGATESETITKVVIPAALPGIVGGVLLAASRAIGETMIVVMAAGLSANLTLNPLDSVTTVTVQIVTLLVGDQEFDSPKTLAAFALGLMLFVVTLLLNFYALHIVRKYREQYE